MNNHITAVDPLIIDIIDIIDKDIKDNKDDFYADEKMHNILENGTINEYLDYVRYKHIYSDELNKPKECLYDKNRYKKQMLDNIWTNIMILENTIKEFRIK